MLKATLNFTNEQLLPCKSWTLIPGGSMLFTHEALRRLADPWILHRCVDDLLMLRAAQVYPYLGNSLVIMNSNSWSIEAATTKVTTIRTIYFHGAFKFEWVAQFSISNIGFLSDL